MKKIIAIVLTLLIIMSCAVPAFAIELQETNTTTIPTFRINGNGATIYDKDGNIIWNTQANVLPGVKDNAAEIVDTLIYALFSGNYKPYEEALVNAIAPGYTPLKLNENGDVDNGSYATVNKSILCTSHQNEYYSGGGLNYDWRIDPYETADFLHEIIVESKANTGETEYNLVARCIGGTIITAYIDKYGTDDVNGIGLIAGAQNGAHIFETLLSGRISVDPDSLEAFVNQISSDENMMGDNELVAFLNSLLQVMNIGRSLGYTTKFVTKILEKVKNDVLPQILLEGYATFPSYWAMVSDEYWDDAINFIFGDENDEKRTTYAGLIEKITYYHEHAFKNQQETLKNFHDNGGKVVIISKYNVSIAPICEDNDVLADGMFKTTSMSYGATCSNTSSTLPKNYTAENPNCTDPEHNHISPDRKVDASTCLFPENTWFIKDSWHDNYGYYYYWLARTVFNSDVELTVNDFENMPQFVQQGDDEDSYIVITDETESRNPNDKAQTSMIKKLINFFQLLIKMLKQLINKDTATTAA